MVDVKGSLKKLFSKLGKKRTAIIKKNIKAEDISSFVEPVSLKNKGKKQSKAPNSKVLAGMCKKNKADAKTFLSAQQVDKGLRTAPNKRFVNGNKKKLFGGLISKLALFFGRKNMKKSKDSALLFAESGKRAGKKASKIKRIYIYAGAGVLVAAVLLTVLLVPLGGAAPKEEEPVPLQAEAEAKAEETDDIAVLAKLQQSTDALSEIETEVTSIPTTPPDETAAPTQKSAPAATTEPEPTPVPVVMDDLIDDFMVEADLYYNDVGYSTNYYEYTKDELYLLAQIIQIEAGGQSYEGKLAVGNVVMNRVLCRGYPGSTITAVITAPGQFAYARHKDRKPKSSAKAAARDILDNQHWVIAQNVYFFRSGSGEGDWGSHPFYKKIGGHCFYTHRYSGRNRNGQVPPSLFDRTYKWPRYGCKPEKRVYRVQYMLNKLGYDVYADSYFGKDTEIALQEFQESKGLDADGVAGPSTIEALIKAYGFEKYYLDFYN